MIENDQSRTRGREEERPWKRGWEPIGDLSPRLILSDLTGLPLLSGSRYFRVARKLPGSVGGGVGPAAGDPYPISEQNMCFSSP